MIFFEPFFLVSLPFFAASLWLFEKNRLRWSLVALVVGAFFVRFWAAGLDPFLHDWDEKWHAVVAKNMLQTGPFRPQLRPELLLPSDHLHWCCAHVWLHKPPFFMWQMAAAMAIFGKNLLAMRLPSVLMGAILPVLLFRFSWLLTASRRAAFAAAWLSALNFYQIELAAGRMALDHNEMALIFWVSASFWAFAEFWASKKKAWLFAIGLAAGAAFLTKWALGLLVFAGWSAAILLDFRNGFWKNAAAWAAAFAVAGAVFLPWDWWAAREFPVEWAYEQSFHIRHLTEVLEGHAGGPMFYLEAADNYFIGGGAIF